MQLHIVCLLDGDLDHGEGTDVEKLVQGVVEVQNHDVESGEPHKPPQVGQRHAKHCSSCAEYAKKSISPLSVITD